MHVVVHWLMTEYDTLIASRLECIHTAFMLHIMMQLRQLYFVRQLLSCSGYSKL